MDDPAPPPAPVPINGVLDLHAFRPADVKPVVLDYLAECQQRGILEVRIIHGKGIGQLQRTVHHLLSTHPEVTSYAIAGQAWGGWGATIVHLRPASPTQGTPSPSPSGATGSTL